MTDNTRVTQDAAAHRYVLEVDGQPLGFACYEEEGERLIFTHTEVDPSLAGQGMGGILARGALDDARARGKRIVPVCTFIAGYVDKHADWNDVVERR